MITSLIEQLQFLRPAWFFAFIPLLLYVALMLRRHKSSMSWKAVCDAQLLPHILTRASGQLSRLPLLLVFIASTLAIVAAAGPVFEKLPQPVFREQSALVILLDLSQSMDATDLRPSRLQRARLKLLDILKARKAGQTALVVYAADAFVVTPLTDDTNTIANLVPSLETSIMPSQGSHAYRAIEKSLALFKQSGVTRGHVLLMTDGIDDSDIDAIESLRAQGHRLSILGIGTPEGSPIPMQGGFLQDANGAIVIPKLRPVELQRAALRGGGLYLNMQADDSDTQRLSALFTKNKIRAGLDQNKLGATDLRADVWKEEGPWLLLLVIPLAALWFRKGWLLCLPLLALPVAEPAHALDMEHLWSSADQQAMHAFNNGNAAAAAEQFQQADWKAAAHYRAGDYEKALEALGKPVSSDDFYNRGNALAQLQRYPEAKKAYDEAIRLDEHNKDAVYNREQVEKLLQQQQDQQQQAGGDEQKNNRQDNKQQDNAAEENQPDAADNEQSKPGQPQQDASQQQQAQNNSSEPAADESRDTSDARQDKQDTNEVEQAMKDSRETEQQQESRQQQAEQDATEQQTQQQEQQAMQPDSSEEINEDDQATEQWLKRIPDDPGLLLRRKFHYQYGRLPEKTPSNEPW